MGVVVDSKPTGPKKDYPVASEGVTPIVLADVEDLGIQASFYGSKPQVRLTWVVDEKDPEGNYFVISRTFTASMHEKSNLYPVVKDILGATPPVPYDLENLIGKANMGVIKNSKQTNEKNKDGSPNKHFGRTFANIATFLSLKPGQTFAVPKDFVRGKDGGKFGKLPQTQSRTAAPAQQQAAPALPAPPPTEVSDEDIPF